uniref:Uncharacterized protein n=1 Tax=Meloidogyne enterolobii TaxID=390850 RepID=A0A6V7YAZ3_MELEN|nr:unnamed protein product [Meloidogyne enterolobii]
MLKHSGIYFSRWPTQNRVKLHTIRFVSASRVEWYYSLSAEIFTSRDIGP